MPVVTKSPKRTRQTRFGFPVDTRKADPTPGDQFATGNDRSAARVRRPRLSLRYARQERAGEP